MFGPGHDLCIIQCRDKDLNKIKWKTDFDKDVIIDNFKCRKWLEFDEEEGTTLK